MKQVEFEAEGIVYKYELPSSSVGSEIILKGSHGKEKLRITGTGVRYFVLDPDTGSWIRKRRPDSKHIHKLIRRWVPWLS